MSKKHTASKIFLFLVTAIAIFISISGFLTSGGQNIVFQLLFLPVTLYLVYSSFVVIKHSNLEVVLSQKKGGLFFYLVVFFALAIIAVNNFAKLRQKETPTTSEEETKILTLSPTPTVVAEKILTVKTENPETKINIREDPSTASKVIGKVLGNEEFVFIGKEGDWYQIKFNNGFGYIHQDYAAVSEE